MPPDPAPPRRAPWTAAEVARLNARQYAAWHPYTCGTCPEAHTRGATPDGWVGPPGSGCPWRQDWCHAADADGLWEELPSELRGLPVGRLPVSDATTTRACPRCGGDGDDPYGDGRCAGCGGSGRVDAAAHPRLAEERRRDELWLANQNRAAEYRAMGG